MRSTLFIAICSFCNAQPITPSTTFTLKGSVTDLITHLPIEGVNVAIAGGKQANAVTDSKGLYVFQELPPGRLFLEISKEGYALLNPLTSSDVTIEIGGLGPVIRNFELPPGASITGRLRDSDSDKLVTNMRVMSLHEDYGMGMKRYVPVGAGGAISKDGHFECTGLLPGEYVLEVIPVIRQTPGTEPGSPLSRPEIAYTHSYFPGVPRLEMATRLILSAGERRTVDVRLTKKEIRSVSGWFDAPGGTSGPISYIVEEEAPGFYRHVTQGSVPQAGRFTIEGLSEGEYTLLIFSAGEGVDQAFLEYPLVIGNRDIENLRLHLQRGLALTGSVLAEKNEPPLPRGRMQFKLEPFKRIHMSSDKPVYTSPNGEFHIEGVLAGKYFASLSMIPAGWAVSRMMYNSTDMRDTAVDLDGTSIDGSLTFYLTSKLARVTGSLKDSAGHPRRATMVTVPETLPTDYNPFSLKTNLTDENGAFFFTDLVAGRYKLVPLYGLEGRSAHDLGLLRTKMDTLTTVDVKPGQTVIVDRPN